MQNHIVKPQTFSVLNFKLWFYTLSFSLLVLSLSGCVVVETIEFVTPEWPPFYSKIIRIYQHTTLKITNSAQVLAIINQPEYELLSQSKSVVASMGQKKKGYKMWLNMVAFDEDALTATRKYLFIEDERPKILSFEPRAYLRFACKMVLTDQILDQPYANENARRIAILRQVLQYVRSDIDQLSLDNKMIGVAGMMIGQGLEAALVELDHSPVEATKLSELTGLEFSHMSFNKGKIRMFVTDDIVRIKMNLGSSIKKYIGHERFKCTQCGYIYNPFAGDPLTRVKPGTSFDNLPSDWTCPQCELEKSGNSNPTKKTPNKPQPFIPPI